MTTHKIIKGDSREMNLIKDESIQLVITSPPYWQLKDYESEAQIGFNDSYENYINNLNFVWQECYRVLEPGCRLCINIGDQFARSVYYGRYKVIPIRTEIIKFCEILGLDYMGAIIWQKKTTTNTTGGASLMGSFPYPRNGIISIDYEFIMLFKKLGRPKSKPSPEDKKQSQMTKGEWKSFFAGHWNFAGAKQDGHIAKFPEELPYRLIKMFSFVNDTVLDPFLGSGTTSLAAKNLNRNSVGYEVNESFNGTIKEKLRVNQQDIEQPRFEFEKDQIKGELDFNKLPYIFQDPHGFDKKVDPKKLNFGSRIDQNGNQERIEYYKVKKVLSPIKLLLNNELVIKLIGLKAINDKYEEAMIFLEKKTKGQQVFLKFDNLKYDSDNNLLCYLYLKNKTFVNAHLLKNGLAEVEESSEFKYLSKFKAIVNEQRRNHGLDPTNN